MKLNCGMVVGMIVVAVMAVLILGKYASSLAEQRERARKTKLEMEARSISRAVGVMSLRDGTPHSLAQKAERFPYVAAVLTNVSKAWRFSCFGAVVENKWVLTSAHCRLYGVHHRVLLLKSLSVPSWSTTHISSTNLQQSNDTHTHRVLFWRVHDKYNATAPSAKFDIAVAKIVVESHPDPTASHFDDRPAVAAVACVWRTVLAMDKSAILTNEVDSFKLGFLNKTLCQGIYNVKLDSSLICADLANYKDCFVHEFGPLFVGNKLVGIVARSPFNCDIKVAVFTNVSYYSTWILRVTHE